MTVLAMFTLARGDVPAMLEEGGTVVLPVGTPVIAVDNTDLYVEMVAILPDGAIAYVSDVLPTYYEREVEFLTSA